MMRKLVFTLASLATLLAGCRSSSDKPAPASVSSVSSGVSAESTPSDAPRFDLQAADSRISFVMDSPLERIHGEVRGGASGSIFVDAAKVSGLRGTIRIDLDKLVLAQEKRGSTDATFGERAVIAKQSEHMKNWLEIGPDVPAADRERFRWASFTIEGLRDIQPAEPDASANVSHIVAQLEGQLELHGHRSKKQVKVDIRFERENGVLRRITGKTLEPLKISLYEHDVRPREAFGKLAKATLESLGQKVTNVVPVELQLVAISR